ncbi:MAG: lipid II flippase MurJ [Actinomycetaceae bacterium]|nr:lipid II flippase MurJ [Actinomycetaceae bacterium]
MSKRLLGAVGLISGLTLLARVVGFGRWFAQFAWVGQGSTANAYASANQIPNIVYEVAAGGALAGITIPLLALPIAKAMREDVSRVASSLLTIALLILVPLAAAVGIFATSIAQLLPVPAGEGAMAQRDLLAMFLRIFSVQIPLYGISVVLTGVLQAHKKFLWPALAPLLSSLVVIATYAIYGAMPGSAGDVSAVSDSAVRVLGWGTTAGVVALCLPLFIPVARLGVKLRPHFGLTRAEARQAFVLGAAGVGTLTAQQVSALTVLTVARGYGDVGTVAIYQYTQALYMLPYAVLAVPIATATFPEIARQVVSAGAQLQHTITQTTRTVAVVGVISAGLLVAGAQPLQAVFEMLKPVPGMAQALVLLAPGLIGFALIFHLSRVLYALHRGRSAGLAASGGWLVVAALSILFAQANEGGDGPAALRTLAAASSVGMTVAAVLLLYAIRDFARIAEILRAAALAAAAVGPGAALAFYCQGFLPSGIGLICVGGALGLALIGLVSAPFLPALRRAL